MKSLPITQVKNKIISSRGGVKVVPRLLFFTHFDKGRLSLLQIQARDDVREEQSFFGANRRVQMTNDPIIPML